MTEVGRGNTGCTDRAGQKQGLLQKKGLLAAVNVLLPTDLRSDTDPPLNLGSFSGCHGLRQVQWQCKTLWKAEQPGLLQFGLILSREKRYFNTQCHNRRDCNNCLFLGHSPCICLLLFRLFCFVINHIYFQAAVIPTRTLAQQIQSPVYLVS